MPKLVVAEAGKKRAFRLGLGSLTVGGGAEARLKLATSAATGVLFELEVTAAGVVLRPRPGTAPLQVAGVPVSGEVTLELGQRVAFAGAELWLEADEPATAASAPAAATPPAAPGPAPRRTSPTAASSSAGRGRERREREPRPGGAPGWLVPVLVVLGVGVAGLFLFKNSLKGADAGAGRAFNLIQAARQERSASRFESALAKLDEIPEAAYTPELKSQADALRAEIRAAAGAADLALLNLSGTKYFDVLLKRYEANYLQGTPERSKVRLFLKRCATFRKRWPRHPELEWIGRQEERFKGYVDMTAPPDWPDVEWEVRDLVDGMPRNYVAAFALLDELATRVEGEERQKVQNRRNELAKGLPEYAQDRLFEARHQFEKKEDTSKAIWWLVHSVAWLGDEELENEAARFLVKMPDLPSHLLGYKESYPERYAAVVQNSIVADWAERTGFTP
jgi:hypothetical protein